MPCLFPPRIGTRTETPSDSTGPASASTDAGPELGLKNHVACPIIASGKTEEARKRRVTVESLSVV